ncbi:MAG: tryptophan synthase subunit alpha [Clostridia bacterium]|nr:tryptophan synthase subunit alpha [Clostridia bacterium]
MRIKDAFENRKAFIAFITCGDPDLETTEKLILEMAESGADLIELGIPFSDPTAEGPTISSANMRALSGGVTTDKIFEMTERLKGRINIPMVFMTYANVVFSYGTERFCRRAAECGMSGIILPDVPYEEKEEFASVCRGEGLEFVSLIAPTSHERIKMIAAEAEGFVYCVSSLGVTGVRSEIKTDISEMINAVKAVTEVPAAVGFGISTPEQAAHMAEKADGVIIGSAIVKIVEKYGRDSVPYVGEYVRSIRTALDQK